MRAWHEESRHRAGVGARGNSESFKSGANDDGLHTEVSDLAILHPTNLRVNSETLMDSARNVRSGFLKDLAVPENFQLTWALDRILGSCSRKVRAPISNPHPNLCTN